MTHGFLPGLSVVPRTSLIYLGLGPVLLSSPSTDFQYHPLSLPQAIDLTARTCALLPVAFEIFVLPSELLKIPFSLVSEIITISYFSHFLSVSFDEFSSSTSTHTPHFFFSQT